MPRPRSFNEDTVLESIMMVFWHKGYAATSAEDLVQASGLGRSSLYNAFSSKEALFEKALDCYLRRTRETAASLDTTDASTTDLIQNLLLSALELEAREERIGCLVTNTAIERAGQDERIASLLSRHFDLLQRSLVHLIERGQQCGEINPSHDATALAGLILATLQGLRVLSKADTTHENQALKDIVDQAILLIR